jgi:hypothetical protein
MNVMATIASRTYETSPRAARQTPETHQKVNQINRDAIRYGTFAEIGAGQEVARWFFRVGGAAGTVAKTMSAYDMQVSDAIYGPSPRYVSRQRLQTMLEYEYGLLMERLYQDRGENTSFFVFANTVAARSFSRQQDSTGWMGIRFQHAPQAKPSEIIIHVHMLDRENLQQQECLGILGVNLVWGAFYLWQDPVALAMSLIDDLSTLRAEVDVIKFSGPAFEGVDDRLMLLHLVQQGLCDAAMFLASGEVVEASEVLHKKPILVERGSFRPVTRVTREMLDGALAQFVQDRSVKAEDVVVMMEMTLHKLTDEAGIDHKDYLERVDLLAALGRNVIISNYFEYYRLAAHLFRYTQERIGIAMGVPSLHEVFEAEYYTHLEGGILESFGRMFKNDLRLYVYPYLEPSTKTLVTVDNFEVAPNLRHLYAHLIQNGHIEPITGFREESLPIFSRDVLARIRAGDASWENMVPEEVARLIKERKLFGYQG